MKRTVLERKSRERFGMFCLLLRTNKKNNALVLNESLSVSKVLSTEYQNVFYLIKNSTNRTLRIKKKCDSAEKELESENRVFSWDSNLLCRKFDLIAAYDVFQILQYNCKDHVPKGMLFTYLYNLHSYLEVGGKLIVGVENLFYIERFRSLDSSIKNFYRMTTQEGRYTFWGYKRLFKRAGFSSIKFYLVIPSNIDPKITCSMDELSRKWFYAKIYPKPKRGIRKIVYNLMNLINIVHYFAPSFLIEVKK